METGSSQNRGSDSRVTVGSGQQNAEVLHLTSKDNALATILEHAATVSAMDISTCRSPSLARATPGILSLQAYSTPLIAGEGLSFSSAQPKKSSVVPNIVVEHISASPGDRQYMRHPAVVQLHASLSPPFSSCWTTIVGRQARALSDSSVCDLEKSLQRCSAPLSFNHVDYPITIDLSTKNTPHEVPSIAHSEVTTVVSLNKPTSRSSLITWPVIPDHEPQIDKGESDSYQFVTTSPRFCGPERSPKAYWLRRHSDSNLSSGQNTNSGLRVDPYPIRSHSTGDSRVLSTMSICNTTSTLDNLELRVEERTSTPSVPRPHNVAEREQGSSFDIQLQEAKLSQVAVKTKSERSILHVFHSVQTKEDPAVNITVDLENCGDCAKTTSEVEMEYKDHSTQKLTREHPASENNGDKRIKLKKYLQARYQMSQHEPQQFSEMDDVFVDRFASPAPISSPGRYPPERSANDLMIGVSRSRSDGATEFLPLQSHIDVSFQTNDVTLPRTSSLCMSKSEILPGYRPPTENLHVLRRMFPQDEHISIKTEPQSPGAVPKGTSVFVFPPPPVVLHDTLSYSHYSRPVSSVASQAPSPLTAGVIECSGWSPQSHRSERIQDCDQDSQHLKDYQQQISSASERGSNRLLYEQKKDNTALSVGQIMEFIVPKTAVRPVGSDLSVRSESKIDGLDFGNNVSASFLRFPKRLSHVSASEHNRWPINSLSLAQVEGLQSFVCPVCSVTFSSCKHLTDHMSVHIARSVSPADVSKEPEVTTGSKPVHLCPICQRTFTRGDMLTRHVRLHTGVRPYECTLCSQVFSRSDHLTTHQRTHTGEKPYRCVVCTYAAPRRDMVTRHARIHETAANLTSASGRRGRRAYSVSGAVPVVATIDPLRLRADQLVHPVRRHRSESGYTTRQHWLHSSADGSHNRSLTSSIESTEGSVATLPITCRAWSTTSAESFESYPGAYAAGSSVSSMTADSQDVFSIHPRHFRWGSEAPSTDYVSHLDDAATCVDVAGVTPVFQKCSVASPPPREQC